MEKLQRLTKRPRVFACYHYSLTLRIVKVVSKIYRQRRMLLYPLFKSNYVGQNKETKPLLMQFSPVLALHNIACGYQRFHHAVNKISPKSV